MTLRHDLAAKSPVTGTVKHGDKLEILEYQHRFVRVRSHEGVEGWTDLRQLLTPDQMASLQRMSDSAQRYPSQGTATVFEMLNMHTEPNRVSPSFWQVPENGKVEVLEHKLAPRVQVAAPARPPAPAKTTTRKKSKDKQAQARIGPPPMPVAPKPPSNWTALSVPKSETASVDDKKAEQKPAAPVPMDDWSLVRTQDAKTGWVLTRMLNMAIPDEVAQYAEGHRITSYFALGKSKEGDVDKTDWLWTTITKGQEPYEFDSFRVFVWSHKHHRYETAYIERNVVGHFPVAVDTRGDAPSFSLILDGNDGQLLRKTYSFEGFRIRMVHKEPYAAPTAEEAAPPAETVAAHAAPKQRSVYAQLKDRVRKLFGR
jgi:Bacterial SH3 domain